MEISDHISNVANLHDIIDVAKTYGLDLDENGRIPCFEGHDPETPTLQFDEETQSFVCLNPECRVHGGLIDLVQRHEKATFPQAVNVLAQVAGLGTWDEEKSQEQFGVDAEEYATVRACLNAAARIYARSLDSALPYLERRGISRQTAEMHLIGATQGKDDLARALVEQGFSERTIHLAGLLNTYGEDFFQERIIVPIRMNGTVVCLYGRALNDENPVKHLHLGKDRYALGHGLFNWNARRKEIIATEGIFDALALIDCGYSHAVATLGTQGLSAEKNLHLLTNSSIRRVQICYDADDPGRKAALNDAYRLEDQGLEVSIVDLGTGDPNEFLTQNTTEEFQERLSEACSPLYFEIGSVNPEWPLERKINALERALRRCKKLKPLDQAAAIERIAELGFSKKLVREHIAALPDEKPDTPEIVDLYDCKPIHPALDVVDGKVLMAIPQLVYNPESRETEWITWVATSDQEFFKLTAEELRERGYYTTSIVHADEPRYSHKVVRAFLAGKAEGNLPQTYWRIVELLRHFLDFPDTRTFLYLSAWTTATYFHPIFNYFPYLHFTGTKNVGKSKSMKLMASLCFNGIMSVSATDASQFRIIEALRPSLFLDETEDLNQKGFSDKRALLLGGYEAGSSVLRTEKVGDEYRVRRLGNFSPRSFASIEGLEDVLASRTVQIQMERSFNDEIKQREVSIKDPILQQIRDELFLATMTKGSLIAEIYHTMEKPEEIEFGDREYNLFKPILTIARAVGNEKVFTALIGFANDNYRLKVAQYNENAEENVLLRYLLDAVTKDDWYQADVLHAKFIEFIRSNGLEMHRKITKSRMGTLLKKLNVTSRDKRSSDRSTTIYFIEVEKLGKVAENYLVM